MAIFRREPSPLTGVSNAGAVGREIAIVSLYLASLHAVNAATSQVLSTHVPWHRRTIVPQVAILIAGSKQQSLLMAGHNEMFMTRNLNATQRQQNSI